jgi:uncharacterized membrane protein
MRRFEPKPAPGAPVVLSRRSAAKDLKMAGSSRLRLSPTGAAATTDSAAVSPRAAGIRCEPAAIRDRSRRARAAIRAKSSSWAQRLPIVGLALLACGISIYLALYQWGLIDSVWDPFFGDGSEKVLDSKTSEDMRKLIGIPDAALGAIGYFSEVVFGLAGCTRRWQFRPWLVLLFGLDVIPLGIVSVILVIAQGVIVKSWCTLCLATAVISLVLVFLAYDEVWASIKFLRRTWTHTRDPKIFWRTFWGIGDGAAAAVALENK